MASKLSNRDKQLLKVGGTFVPGTRRFEGGPFGNGEENDFIKLSIIEPTTNRIITSKEVEPNIIDSQIVVKPGVDIREMGFASGRFSFRYEFYRRLAGSEDVVLINTKDGNYGDIYNGQYFLKPNGDYHAGTPEQLREQGEEAAFQLLPQKMNYEVAEISPSRKEIRIRAKKINDDVYKEDLYDRGFAFKTFISDASYRQRTGTHPVVRFFNPFNPNMSSPSNFGFGAHSGGPPVDDDTSSTHLLLEDAAGFSFKPIMQDASIRIKDAYIIGEREEIVITENNILSNPSGDTILFDENLNPQKPIGVQDIELHTDAIKVEAWSDGILAYNNPQQGFYGTGPIGYHAKWVKGEGRNGGQCIKFLDRNAIYRNDTQWPGEQGVHRPLVISSGLPAISNYGVTPGADLFYITYFQKASDTNKGANISIKYGAGFGVGEPRPTEPPAGFHIPGQDIGETPDTLPAGYLAEPTEQRPSDELQGNQGEGLLSSGKQWFVSSIQNGLYVWEPNYSNYNTADGASQGVLGIRKVGAQIQTEGTDGTNRTWIWKGTTWLPEIPAVIPGCTDASALNYQSYAQEDDGSCVFEQSILPSTRDFDVVFKCRHKEYFGHVAPWNSFSGDHATFFLKYDDTLGDYHIWQSRFGGSENAVNYRFGLSTLFGKTKQSNDFTLGESAVSVKKTSNGFIGEAVAENGPGLLTLMTKFGRIKDISEYHRYKSGHSNKRKGLIMLVEFSTDYRDFVENEANATEDQAQGIIIEYSVDGDANPGKIVGCQFYSKGPGSNEVEPGENDLGTLDELRFAVFEDVDNKNDPRFWFLGDTGQPARARTASGARIIDPYKNDDYFESWIGTGLGSFQAIFGDDSSEKYVGISGDQVYATELSATAQYLPGYPRPISDVYAGVGEKDLYVNRGCANPFANNYGEISEGEEAGNNPVTNLKNLIETAEVGGIIPFGGIVKVVAENAQERQPNILQGRTFLEQRKSTLISKLNAPSYSLRKSLNIPNINGGNCDFSVSNDPLKNGTMSPSGFWKWNGPDAVWEYQGDTPAAIEYKTIELNGQANSIVNDWEMMEGTAPIPEDMLTNEPMQLIVEGHRIGGADGNSTQGIVWVDDFDLRFQKPGETTNQNIYADYIGSIKKIEGNDLIKLDRSFDEVGEELGALQVPSNTGRENRTRGGQPADVTKPFKNFEIRYRVNDNEELRTYIEVRGEKYLTTNFRIDKKSTPDYPHAVDYKLYTPLGNVVSKFDSVSIVKEMALPYEDSIDIIDYVPQDIKGTVLLSPKLEDSESPLRARPTSMHTEETLLSSNVDIKEKLQNIILSGSLEETELNIPHDKGFREFTHFSSAEKRIRNFKYKLELIESYTQSSASSAGITQANYGTEKQDSDIWHQRIRNVKNGFDSFEKYMFEQSSSYYSSSMGTFHDNAWPKLSGAGTMNSPYVLAHTTSSEATSWFNLQMVSSSEYDSRNGNYLINNMPQFVNTQENQAYLDFIKMMGQMFDKIWLYIKQTGMINDRRENISEGLSKQLYYSVAKSLGWGLSDGKDLVDLPNFALGQRSSGSAGGFEEIERTEQDISREIWSRIVSNMPYFLKNKGTVRALKGLINCYGIPSSILRVKEYGGPDTPSSVNFAIDRKFTKALGFRGGQRVHFTWQEASASVAGDAAQFPDTVEWRFKAPHSQNQIIWNKVSSAKNTMGIVMKDNNNADNIGSLLFYLSGSDGWKATSSSLMPIYDDEFYSAMIRRTPQSASIQNSVDYNLVIKKYDAGIDRFQYVSSNTLTINGATAAGKTYNSSWDSFGTFNIGGASVLTGPETGSVDFNKLPIQRYSGSLMEVRVWTETLNTGSFDNHVGNPKAYDGNSVSSSYEHIVSRYSFDDDKNLQSDPVIRDVSAKTTETQNATAVGFTSNTFESVVDRTKSLVPNLGPSKPSTNKIRIEANVVRPEFQYISGSDGMYTELQSEKPIGRGRYDFAPTDGNKVGIYFSPSDAINQDIIESLANIDFGNFLGDPRDRYSETYRGLDAAQDKYWQKYNAPFSFFQYLKLLKTYDQSIFPQLKKLTPARANARFGILVEPNLLERAREVVGKQPFFENTYYETLLPISESYYAPGIAEYKVYGQPYSPSTDTSFDEINQSIQFYTNDASASAVRIQGENKLYEGVLSQSRLENFEHSILERKGQPGDIYASASVTFGDSFKDQQPLQPNVTGSRLNPLKGRIKLFYSSEYSASIESPSSFSYEPAEINVPADSSTAMRRLFYEGVKNTKFTTQDGLDAVEVTLTSPTRIVTKEPGDSKLDIE